jgi:hypothetical protein
VATDAVVQIGSAYWLHVPVGRRISCSGRAPKKIRRGGSLSPGSAEDFLATQIGRPLPTTSC